MCTVPWTRFRGAFVESEFLGLSSCECLHREGIFADQVVTGDQFEVDSESEGLRFLRAGVEEPLFSGGELHEDFDCGYWIRSHGACVG